MAAEGSDMKTSVILSLTLAASIPMSFSADEATKNKADAKDKNLIEKTGDSLKKAGDKAVDLVTTSEEEKKKDAKADAEKKSADQKADKIKNDAKADNFKKAADEKAEKTKNSGEKK
jgi:hypothetical protein